MNIRNIRNREEEKNKHFPSLIRFLWTLKDKSKVRGDF